MQELAPSTTDEEVGMIINGFVQNLQNLMKMKPVLESQQSMSKDLPCLLCPISEPKQEKIMKNTKEKTKNLTSAEGTVRRPFEVNPRQTAALLLTGHRLYSHGRQDDARNIFEGLAALNGRNPYVYGILGSIDHKEGKLEQAISFYTLAIDLFPDLYSLANRGEVYLKLGKFKDAADDFRNVIGLNPKVNHPAAARARLLAGLAQDALRIANEKGIHAILRPS